MSHVQGGEDLASVMVEEEFVGGADGRWIDRLYVLRLLAAKGVYHIVLLFI